MPHCIGPNSKLHTPNSEFPILPICWEKKYVIKIISQMFLIYNICNAYMRKKVYIKYILNCKVDLKF